jgi:hypothetical protein
MAHLGGWPPGISRYRKSSRTPSTTSTTPSSIVPTFCFAGPWWRLGWPRDRKIKLRSADGCEVGRKWKKGEYEENMVRKPGRYGYRCQNRSHLTPTASIP